MQKVEGSTPFARSKLPLLPVRRLARFALTTLGTAMQFVARQTPFVSFTEKPGCAGGVGR